MATQKLHPFYRLLASMKGHRKVELVTDMWAIDIIRTRVYRENGYAADEAPLLIFYVEKDGKFTIDGDHMKNIAASIGQSLFGAILRKFIQ